MVTNIIKRAGHSEPYAENKLKASLEHAALSIRALEGEAELLADRVASSVTTWIQDKAEVTSVDVRRVASEFLGELHAEAAYSYDVHDHSL